MRLRRLLIVVGLVICFSYSLFSCTMVMVAKGKVILAGNNEDWRNPETRMWVYPARKGEYGRICFGFDNGWTQGGINDQGLFIDANALSPRSDWESNPKKKTYQSNLMDHILIHCSTVEEAISFFKKYNFPSLKRAKFPIADAKGEAAVVEWGKGKLQVLKRKGRYQISTNFVQVNYEPDEYPCARYKMADKILGSTDDATLDLVRSVLSATHSEYSYPTLYSNIYDLANKKIYLYNFHNFEEVKVFDVIEELKKGEKTYEIPELFSVKTQAARLFERYRK